MKNYYKILNIDPKAEKGEIEKQLYDLHRKTRYIASYAPDEKLKSQAREKLKTIEEAMDILVDEKEKREYDRKLLEPDGLITTKAEEKDNKSLYLKNGKTFNIFRPYDFLVVENRDKSIFSEYDLKHRKEKEEKLTDKEVSDKEVRQKKPSEGKKYIKKLIWNMSHLNLSQQPMNQNLNQLNWKRKKLKEANIGINFGLGLEKLFLGFPL
ncbi:MAG: DnaJ domain-containing protein [Tissierellia bacterium]|nr:DnaJ domain-containing protein [Tissierellia bacterium]